MLSVFFLFFVFRVKSSNPKLIGICRVIYLSTLSVVICATLKKISKKIQHWEKLVWNFWFMFQFWSNKACAQAYNSLIMVNLNPGNLFLSKLSFFEFFFSVLFWEPNISQKIIVCLQNNLEKQILILCWLFLLF